MKPTVAKGLSARAIAADDVLTVLNDEWRPLLEQVRAAVNAQSVFTGGVATDGVAAYATAWQSEPGPNAGMWLVEARASIIDTAGAAAAYVLVAAFRWSGGTPVQVGATAVTALLETAAGFDARFAVDGDTVLVELLDNGAVAKAQAVVSVLEAVL